jgi:small subunit ribosomal protein S5
MADNRPERYEQPGPEELSEKVIYINRVAKVVKGGRRFSFSALVVVGDGRGSVGVGLGKANEVPEAIRKGSAQARRNMVRIPMKGGTISHPVWVRFKAAKVMLKPASHGTGVIAGGAVRSIMEAAGVTDVLAKTFGSRNPINVAQATIRGLATLQDTDGARERRLAIARGEQ